jgi:hypothetical protein
MPTSGNAIALSRCPFIHSQTATQMASTPTAMNSRLSCFSAMM